MSVLPEVGVCRRPEHPASWGSRDGKPHFSNTCPCCGQKLVFKDGWVAEYACGAKYTMKPQCQNHTDVFWGTCPSDLKEKQNEKL